jgi:hypothetical protein
MSNFVFCDWHYRAGESARDDVPGALKSIDRRVMRETGHPRELAARELLDGRGMPLPRGEYRRRESPVCRVQERYCCAGQDRTIIVNLWGGHAEAIMPREFIPRSIGCFMHRGDGMGEGGSNLHFLDSGPSAFGAIRLFDVLAPLLAERAIILTDGSNTSLDPLWRIGADARDKPPIGKMFESWGFRWVCIGALDPRPGPRGLHYTEAWRVERMEAASTADKPDRHTQTGAAAGTSTA